MLYTRRRLPHWIPDARVIFVTCRLMGSLPRPKPEILTAENTGRAGFIYSDPLPPSPKWLGDARIAQVVEDTLRFGESRGSYVLHAWVIMLNHIHFLIEPLTSLADIMRWFKGRTARVANRVLERTGEAFWQDESYDHWIRSERELYETIRYIENNPVRAGFVETRELWSWSSSVPGRRRKTIVCPTEAS